MTKIKIDLDLAKRVLSVDEALSLLEPHRAKRKQRVHTFINIGFALCGCDMDLTHIKRELKAISNDKNQLDAIQIAGVNMNRVGHGIAYWSKKKWMGIPQNGQNKTR